MQYLTPRNALLLCLAVVCVLVIASCIPRRLREAGPFPEPEQTELQEPVNLDSPAEGFEVRASDQYRLEAMVMSRARYWQDAGAKLAPIDLAIAWGPLTREPLLNGIKYNQYGRYYHYQWPRGLTTDAAEIGRYSSNTHIVIPPDRPELRSFLMGIRRGDCIRLNGYLVSIFGKGGWRWKSSRSREDRNGGACELLYVTSGEKIEP